MTPSQSLLPSPCRCAALALALASAVLATGRATVDAASPVEAERHQTYTTGVSDTPDLQTVWAWWPFLVEPETCDGDHSDYCIRVEGPRLLEGGGHSEHYTAALKVCVRHGRFGPEPGNEGTRMYSECPRCPNNVGKYKDHGVYSGDTIAIINYDAINDRWGLYAGGIVRVIDSQDAGMDGADYLRVGGMVTSDRSILGPFFHKTVQVKLLASQLQESFTPTNTAEDLLHEPPPGRYHSLWWSSGTVAVTTTGPLQCN